jgi:tRNA(fMet)-specific endonuclease VapC
VKYLLDTNAAIGLLNDKSSKLAKRVRSQAPSDIGVSSIVVHELSFGAFKSQRKDRNVELIDNLLFEVVEFDKDDARDAGELRAQLRSIGKPIGPFDTLIAGQARSRNLILITSNLDEFRRVPNLRIENWQD